MGGISAAVLLERLRASRFDWLRKLEMLTEDEGAITALHPCLQQPIRVLDWAIFVAEHDDHHLSHAPSAILEASRGGATTSTEGRHGS